MQSPKSVERDLRGHPSLQLSAITDERLPSFSDRVPDADARDDEERLDWLERLISLNRVVAASGEPLVGNLFYRHNRQDYVGQPPDGVFKDKRERFRAAVRQSRCLLEIGVNGGHSAFLALSSNPQLEYHGIDTCEHTYVEAAVSWLRDEFPGRVSFYRGDSLEVVPTLASKGFRFDLFHIDGAKYNYYDDIVNCSRLLDAPCALVVVDDAELLSARVALVSLKALGVVRSLPQFPTMSESDPSRNEIRELVPTRGLKTAALEMFSRLLTLARWAKALWWRDTAWAHARRNRRSVADFFG